MTRVLLVDDDAWLADALAAYMSVESITVDIASDAIQACEYVERCQYDGIVLDMFLPGYSGVTFLHELRSQASAQYAPVVIMSSLAQRYTKKALEPYGVVDILDKTTMHPSDIIACLRRAEIV